MIALLLFVAGLIGCGGGGGERGATPSSNTPAASTDTTGAAGYTFSGKVTDESDAALAGVSVSVNGGAAVTTDSSGDFTVAMPLPGASGDTVNLSLNKAGYVPGFKNYETASGDVSAGGTYSAVMMIQRDADSIDEGTQAQITHADGSAETVAPVVNIEGGLAVTRTTVTVAADDRAVAFTTPADAGDPADVTFTVGDPSGAGANAAAVLGAAGSYIGAVTYGDPTDAGDLTAFPGDFTTDDDTGAGVTGTGALITAGFARISLTDTSGQPVTQFASGTSASITMRVPSTSINPETGVSVSVGDTIPVLIFNESTGEWVVERNADNSIKRATVQSDADGLYVTFTTTHLTWFNLDWKSEVCDAFTPKVNLVDGDGATVKGATYHALIQGWTKQLVDYRNTGSMVILRAPADVDWELWAEKNGAVTEVVTISDCKRSGTGQSEFTLTLNQTCTPACETDAQCSDGNDNTLDACNGAGTCAASCIHNDLACYLDSDCNDNNADTIDVCLNPGTAQATCINNSDFCSVDVECDDGDPSTNDVCYYYTSSSSFSSFCNNYSHQCDNDDDCDDGIPETTNSCIEYGPEYSFCAYQVFCQTDEDCNDNEDFTIDTCWDNQYGPDYCAHSYSSCASDSECAISLPEAVGFCVDEIANFATCNYAFSCNSDNECSDDYSGTIDSCETSKFGTKYCVHKECATDMDCVDNDLETTETCIEYSTGSTWCRNYIPCTIDTDCDDNYSANIDYCYNTDPYYYPYCSHIYPDCFNDSDCNDNNTETMDVCIDPGTWTAHCNHPRVSGRAIPAGRAGARPPATPPSGETPPWMPPPPPHLRK